jgi:hypothetical protein
MNVTAYGVAYRSYLQATLALSLIDTHCSSLQRALSLFRLLSLHQSFFGSGFQRWTFPVPKLPASNSNGSHGLNRSSPPPNSVTHQPTRSTSLNWINWSQTHLATDGKPVCLSWCQAPSEAQNQMLLLVWKFSPVYAERLSDERSGLSFVRVIVCSCKTVISMYWTNSTPLNVCLQHHGLDSTEHAVPTVVLLLRHAAVARTV